jgi:Helix-turn-helix domain/Domain of unknown function (DUF4115)
MELMGDVLRVERQRRSLELEQVSAATKIGVHFLQAIEANRFELLPGGLLTRSFVRQYARVLDLDEGNVIAAFKEQFPDREELLPLPRPLASRGGIPLMPTPAWLVLAILVCGGVYGFWQGVRRSLPEPGIGAASLQLPPDPTSFRLKSVDPAPPPQLVAPSVPAKPAAMGLQAHPMRAVLTAKEPVWISIKSEGKQMFSGMLDEKQTKELDVPGKIVVLVGNAGGLEVSMNGKPIGSIGQQGEVRLLELTPDGAHITHRGSSEDVKGTQTSEKPDHLF